MRRSGLLRGGEREWRVAVEGEGEGPGSGSGSGSMSASLERRKEVDRIMAEAMVWRRRVGMWQYNICCVPHKWMGRQGSARGSRVLPTKWEQNSRGPPDWRGGMKQRGRGLSSRWHRGTEAECDRFVKWAISLLRLKRNRYNRGQTLRSALAGTIFAVTPSSVPTEGMQTEGFTGEEWFGTNDSPSGAGPCEPVLMIGSAACEQSSHYCV